MFSLVILDMFSLVIPDVFSAVLPSITLSLLYLFLQIFYLGQKCEDWPNSKMPRGAILENEGGGIM